MSHVHTSKCVLQRDRQRRQPVTHSSRSGVELQKGCSHRPVSSGRAGSREGEMDSARHLQALTAKILEVVARAHHGAD